METLTWGHGEPVTGTPFRIVVDPAQTGGRLVVLAVDMPPGERVAEHVHEDEDQVMVVVEGRIGISVDGVESVLETGAVAVMPRGLPHALWSLEEDRPARLLDLYTPAGFEQWFVQAGLRAVGAADAGDVVPVSS